MDRIRYCLFWILIPQGCSIVHSSRYHDKIDNTARRYRDRIDPHNQVTQQQARGWICVQGQKHTQTARDTAKHKSPDLLDLSDDACIVPVSDKTLFILRERISQARDGFQITTWHCRIHRLMCSPSNSQSRSKHRETDEQTGRRKQARNKGQNLPALPCKNTPATAGKQNHPAVPVPHTNRRTCLLDKKKLCTSKRVQRETVATQGRAWFRQFMFAVALRMHSKLVSSHVHNESSN